ncbi:MAG: hypothetical protein K8T89_15340 [Planctomycetes bacterium]|nr:hypothetical protein [Planctomycetota bacterium]
MHAAVGKYVKIDGRCYQASVAVDGVVTHSSLNYRGPFATCAACNAAPIEARKLFITSLRLDGTNLVATSEEMIIRDGRVVGFCPAAEFVIEGTDCPEP